MHWLNNNANLSGAIRKKSLLCRKSAISKILSEKPPFLAFPEAKKAVVNYARLRKAVHWLNNNANLSGAIRKKSLLCRKARYVRSLGKKPHFWPSQRLKKVLLTTQGCARLCTGPIIMQIPRGLSEKKVYCVESLRYLRSLGKNPHFWPSQMLKKVLLTTQGCARLRTGPIIMQIPWGIRKKSLLCRKARYVRSLGKKPHF